VDFQAADWPLRDANECRQSAFDAWDSPLWQMACALPERRVFRSGAWDGDLPNGMSGAPVGVDRSTGLQPGCALAVRGRRRSDLEPRRFRPAAAPAQSSSARHGPELSPLGDQAAAHGQGWYLALPGLSASCRAPTAETARRVATVWASITLASGGLDRPARVLWRDPAATPCSRR